MTVSRTNKLFLTGAIGFGSVLALATPALADTPAHEGDEMEIILPAPQPEPGDIIVMPTPEPPQDFDNPEPKPEPKPADDLDFDGPEQPEPQPNPDLPPGPGEVTDTPDCTHGCGPDGAPDDKGAPNQDPEVNPDLPEGPGELTDGEDGCQLTHGCPDEETPGDTPADDSADADDDAEVLSESEDRGALPRTGTGIAILAAAGTALTGVGAAFRKAARR